MGSRHQVMTLYLTNIARGYESLGQWDKAMEFYFRVIDVALGGGGLAPLKFALPWRTLLTATSKGMCPRAGSCTSCVHSTSVSLCKCFYICLAPGMVHCNTLRMYGHNHEETAHFLEAVGHTHHMMFEVDKAIKCFVRALAIYCETIGMMNMASGAVCKGIGHCLVTMGRVDEAVMYQSWAVEVFTKCLGMHCETARAIFDFAQSVASLEEW